MAEGMTIEITNASDVIKKLKRYQNKITNLRTVMVELGKDRVDFYSTVPFVSQGGIYGERWTPLSPGYRKWKSKNYAGKGILVREGKMQSGFRYRASRDSVRISNPVEHFRKHQLGEGHMPQRVMMKLDKQRRRDAASVLHDEIIKMFRGL